jgi:hypothetical protein
LNENGGSRDIQVPDIRLFYLFIVFLFNLFVEKEENKPLFMKLVSIHGLFLVTGSTVRVGPYKIDVCCFQNKVQ